MMRCTWSAGKGSKVGKELERGGDRKRSIIIFRKFCLTGHLKGVSVRGNAGRILGARSVAKNVCQSRAVRTRVRMMPVNSTHPDYDASMVDWARWGRFESLFCNFGLGEPFLDLFSFCPINQPHTIPPTIRPFLTTQIMSVSQAQL
jgi:hypothetical protein